MNFTMGLAMALLFFWTSLWGIVRSYEPNPFVATALFLCSAAAGFSYVVSYILAIYGAAAGGVYGLLKVAESSQRRRAHIGGAQQPPPPRMGYNFSGYNNQNDRPHYE